MCNCISALFCKGKQYALLLACALLVPRRDKLLRPWRRLRPQKLREA